MKRLSLGTVAHCIAATALLAPALVQAQDHLVRARMEVDIGAAGESVSVRIRYLVAPATGSTAVPVAAVRFGGAVLEAVRASVAGAPTDFELDGLEGSRVMGAIPLPAPAVGEVPVEVSYIVRAAAVDKRRRVEVPVLAVLWPPAEALPGTFTATVRLPPGTAAFDALPSLLRETGTADRSRRYEARLQVVPALLSFQLTDGRSPFLTLTAVIDVIAILLLLLVGYVGWLRFRTRS